MSRVKSVKSPPFPIENLIKDVLFKIMLELPREQLNALCRASKRYREICKNDLFRKLYIAKHPNQLFTGKLTWNKGSSTDFYIYKAEDEKGNKLQFYKYGKNIVTVYINSTSELSIYGGMSSMIKNIDSDRRDRIEVLNSIGKLDRKTQLVK